MSKKRNTANTVLLVLGIFIALFIIAMMITYWVMGSVPDTLIQYTLGGSGLEVLVLAAIKVSKVWVGEKEREDSDG